MKKIGAIFDWDGVVVDSGRLHVASWSALAAAEGLPLPHVPGLGGLGLKGEKVIADLLRWTQDPTEIRRLLSRKEKLFQDTILRESINAIPGVIAFLQALKKNGIPAAVGSSAPRKNVEVCVAALGLEGLFAAVVAAEDVQHGKPAPDVFLKAAAQLGCTPTTSAVFEDAPAGIAAARAAGIKCIGVLSTRTREELAGADHYIHSFAELSIASFRSFLA